MNQVNPSWSIDELRGDSTGNDGACFESEQRACGGLAYCLKAFSRNKEARPVEPLGLLKRARELERVIEGVALEGSDPERKVEHVKKLQERLIGFCRSKKIKSGFHFVVDHHDGCFGT